MSDTRQLYNLGHVERCEIGGFTAIGYSRGEGDVAYVSSLEEAERMISAANCHDDLVRALHEAHDFIAELQRLGCPAGPVAVPSRIRDALINAKESTK